MSWKILMSITLKLDKLNTGCMYNSCYSNLALVTYPKGLNQYERLLHYCIEYIFLDSERRSRKLKPFVFFFCLPVVSSKLLPTA